MRQSKKLTKSAKQSNPILLSVPLIILRLILESVYSTSRRDFLNFRFVSRACRHESRYLLFRSVSINDDSPSAKSRAREFIARITDREYNVGEHVRDLKLGPFEDEEWFYFDVTPRLEDVLRNIPDLRSLTWRTHRAARPEMVKLLYQLHPSARLNLVLRDRRFTPLSGALLSSPQLHSLDITVYYVYPAQQYTNGYSELAFVKDCISKNTRLRVLSLDTQVLQSPFDKTIPKWEHVRRGPKQFEWHEDDKFPVLEELTLDHEHWVFSREQCQMWAKVTSWERLRRLDLAKGAPQYFIASLTNRAVNLEYFKFYISHRAHSTWHLDLLGTGIPILTNFLASITALRKLDFGIDTPTGVKDSLQSILESTRGNVKVLRLHWDAFNMPPWEPKEYKDIIELMPGLEVFQANIQEDTFDGCWKGPEIDADPWVKYATATKQITSVPAQRVERRGQQTQRTLRIVF